MDSTTARIMWRCVPSDCKKSLAEIERRGEMLKARDEICADAHRVLEIIGRASPLDLAHALEAAAKGWLERNPLP